MIGIRPIMSVYLSPRLAAFILLTAFVLTGILTSPAYIADTMRYANDVLRHDAREPGQFWEFGHLLWRPWGYAGLKVAAAGFARLFGDTPMQGVIRFLMCTAWLCAAASLLMTYRLLSAAVPARAALASTLAVLFANPFLNYSRSGAPYVPALCFLLLALCLLVGAVERGRSGWWLAGAAGASFVVSFSLWFPFSLAGIGAAALALIWPGAKCGGSSLELRRRWRLVAVFCATAGLAGGIVFAFGAYAHGAWTISKLMAWVQASKNDWQQNLTAVRLAAGLPRAIYDLAADGLLLKRRLFHDPYNPVAATAIVPILVKVGWFFLTAGLAGAVLLFRAKRRWILAIALCGTFPLILFSVFLFEPGSPERFLPAYPFGFLACAAVLAEWRSNRVCAAAVAVLFCTAALSNVWALNSRSFAIRKQAVVARKAALRRHTNARSATVYVVSLRDDLYRLPAARPLDRDLLAPKLRILDVIEVASGTLTSWKARFASRTLAAWREGEEVWVSRRLLARRPAAAWEWVEGDDKRVRWVDLPDFFAQFETSPMTDGQPDGFVRVLATGSNRDRLELEALSDGKPHAGQRGRSGGTQYSRMERPTLR